MKDLEYLQASSLSEALTYLADHGAEARVMAGATDLLIDMRYKGLAPQYLLNINRVPGLAFIREEAGRLSIGPLTKIRDMETSDLLQRRYPAIAEAAGQIGSVQIRNMATLGGNLVHAAPSAEMAPPLMVHYAVFDLVSRGGSRRVPATEFFTGPGKTVMEPDEILTAITMPATAAGWAAAYLRLSVRDALDIAIVNVAAGLRVESGLIVRARVALGAVAPTPFLSASAESALAGKPASDATFAEAARLAAEESSPITDVRASKEYRRQMVRVLVERALHTAAHRATSHNGRS